MSKAEPMGANRRAASYSQGGRNFTPRQYRRWRHKHNRADGGTGYWGEGCKGRPTPRQRKAAPA